MADVPRSGTCARSPRGSQSFSLEAGTRTGPHRSDRPGRGRALPRGVPDAHPDGGGGRPSGERPEPRERAGPRAGRAPGRGSRGGGAPARAPNGPGCSREVTAAARGSVEAPPPSPVRAGVLSGGKRRRGVHGGPGRTGGPPATLPRQHEADAAAPQPARRGARAAAAAGAALTARRSSGRPERGGRGGRRASAAHRDPGP